jgi:hypothetical protein
MRGFISLNTPTLAAACTLYVAIILIAGLWPFNFHPANKVRRLIAPAGIRFFGQGIVYGPELLKTRDARARNNSMAVELLLRPQKGKGYMTILTLYDGDKATFIIGQRKEEALYTNTPFGCNCRVLERYREIGIDKILEEDKSKLVTILSDKKSTDIYVDGVLEKASRFSLVP